MSTKNSNTGIIYFITKQINKVLQLGETGQIDSFLSRVIKTLSKEIKALEKIASNEEFNHETRMEELEDRLHDAQQELKDSYLCIDLDRIGTNQKETNYVDVYINNIDAHTIAVQKLEEAIKEEKENYEKGVEVFQKTKESLQKRITAISAE